MQSSSADSDVSNSESELGAFDEWRDDTIAFPTITDALLASLAFSKEIDTSSLEVFLSLVQNPRFNPRECTLHNLTEIHSYAHNARKAQIEERNALAAQKQACSVPSFVWEEVILHIGSQWVDFVSESFEDHADFGGPKRTFEGGYNRNQEMLALRAASVVHRSWTSPAQRQLGRVLLLHDLNDAALTSALRSPLYGNWTQIITIKGSSAIKTPSDSDGWGAPWRQAVVQHVDLLSPTLPRLRTLLARLPCITNLYFESSFIAHPLALLSALKTASTLQVLSIFFNSHHLNDATKDLVAMLPQWPSLKRLSLVGFVWDTSIMDLLVRPDPLLSHFIISGGGRTLEPNTLIQRIRLAKRLEGSFGPPEVWMGRCDDTLWGGFIEDEDEDAIPIDDSLTWLSSVTMLHLMSIRQSEAEQIFNVLSVVDHLSWSSGLFIPSFCLPSSVRTLQLSLKVADGYDWQARDRALLSFLLIEGNADFKELWLSVGIQENFRGLFSETGEDFLDMYLPRASKLCKQAGILFTPLISFDANINGQKSCFVPARVTTKLTSRFFKFQLDLGRLFNQDS